MMFKKLLIGASIVGVMVSFSVQIATASDPKWREKQEALFEEIGLKPGDVIESADWSKVDGLVPPEMAEWLKKGDFPEMKIAEFKYDIAPDDEWTNAGRKNAGKFRLDKKKNIMEVATGKPPLWIDGIPFPNLDLKNDPDGAVKYMYNRDISVRRTGATYSPWTTDTIDRAGVVRSTGGVAIDYLYWARPDGPVKNPNKRLYMDLITADTPYDVSGTVVSTLRNLDGSEDEVFVYIPAVRRARKLSGANRSDPWMGTDFTPDDVRGWSGLNSSMKWGFIEEKVGLEAVSGGISERAIKLEQKPDGTWITQIGVEGVKFGLYVEGWKGAQWAPVNFFYVPRTFCLIEAIPLDPYYASGRVVYWIDKGTSWIVYKEVWDRAMERWKLFVYTPTVLKWAGKQGCQGIGHGYICVDKKTGHATFSATFGMVGGKEYRHEFNSKRVNPKIFSVQSLSMWSK